jgi:hypothetical protein
VRGLACARRLPGTLAIKVRTLEHLLLLFALGLAGGCASPNHVAGTWLSKGDDQVIVVLNRDNTCLITFTGPDRRQGKCRYESDGNAGNITTFEVLEGPGPEGSFKPLYFEYESETGTLRFGGHRPVRLFRAP